MGRCPEGGTSAPSEPPRHPPPSTDSYASAMHALIPASIPCAVRRRRRRHARATEPRDLLTSAASLVSPPAPHRIALPASLLYCTAATIIMPLPFYEQPTAVSV